MKNWFLFELLVSPTVSLIMRSMTMCLHDISFFILITLKSDMLYDFRMCLCTATVDVSYVAIAYMIAWLSDGNILTKNIKTDFELVARYCSNY